MKLPKNKTPKLFQTKVLDWHRLKAYTENGDDINQKEL